MPQLDARYRNGRIPEAFEAEHCVDPGLDVAMILLDQIVQILRRSQCRGRRQILVRLHFAHRAVRRSITVQRDCLRSEPLTPGRFREESIGRSDIAPGTEPEVDRLSCSINDTVKVDPFAAIFTYVPSTRQERPADLANRSHRLTNSGVKRLSQTHDCRMRQRQTALGHHIE
jgi:hypothetical protein